MIVSVIDRSPYEIRKGRSGHSFNEFCSFADCTEALGFGQPLKVPVAHRLDRGHFIPLMFVGGVAEKISGRWGGRTKEPRKILPHGVRGAGHRPGNALKGFTGRCKGRQYLQNRIERFRVKFILLEKALMGLSKSGN